MSTSTTRRALLLVVSAYTAALLLFAWLGHPIPVWGRENDAYVLTAEAILRGELPADPYRPALYPLTIAALGFVFGGGCFAAAKTISCLGAALFIASAHRLAATCFGVRAAWWTLAACAVNGWVITTGVEATTDMLWAGLCLWTLAECADVAERRRPCRVGWIAVAFSLAAWTRYQSVVLVLPIVVALLAATAVPIRSRVAALIRWAAISAACLIPHFVLTWVTFGSPFHNENWRNVAVKYRADLDLAKLRDVPDDGFWSIFVSDFPRVAAMWFDDLGRFFVDVVPRLLQGGGWGMVGAVLAAVAVVSWLRALVRGNRPFAVISVFIAAYVALVCLTFHPVTGVLLVVVPTGFAAVFGWLQAADSRLRDGLGLAVVAALAAVAPGRLATFVARHPTAEVEAARELVRALPVPIAYLSPYPYLETLAGPRCVPLILPTRTDTGWVERFHQQILERAALHEAQFAVLGSRIVGSDARWHAIAGSPLPDQIEPLPIGGPDVRVLRIRQREWVAGGRAVPDPSGRGGNGHVLEVDLTDEIALDDVAGVAIHALSPSRATLSVPLVHAAERTFRTEFVVAPPEPGTWTLRPVVCNRNGLYRIGETFVLTVE